MSSAQSTLIRERLRQLYALLREHFGYHPQWWPGSPWEITLSAILVQQCGWQAAWKGVTELQSAGLMPLEALAEASPERILEVIYGVAYGPTKAGRLQSLARNVLNAGHATIEEFLASGDMPTVRQKLLAQPGIGPETADSILLYAGPHPAFVVDAYLCRTFHRLHVLPVADTFWKNYDRVQEFFAGHLAADLPAYAGWTWDESLPPLTALFRDFHALIVELGRHHCLKSSPRCTATGKPGWPGYDVCTRHCVQAGTCTACPLRDVCQQVGITRSVA
jgi:endonuclease-3 related protein